MAMSGGTAKLVESGTPPKWPGPVSLYVYYKESSQSVTDNTTTLSLGMYVKTPSGWDIGGWTDFYGSYIGLATSGDDCKTFDGDIPNFKGTRWLVENQNFTVNHNSDGTKTVTIYWKWGVNSGWSGVMVKPSGSFTLDLTDIDRAAPTVSFSVSSITVNSFNISASSSATSDKWDYSLDDGSTWKNFSTTSGTSASVTVSGLDVNTTYNVKVRARRAYNQVYGTSSAKSVKTLGYTLFNSCAAFYVDASTAQIKPNVTVYDSDFTHDIVFKDGSTELFTISDVEWAAGTDTKTLSLTTDQKDKLLDCMTTVKSKAFTVVIETYNGSTLIGSKSISVTANTSAANSAPTFTGFSYADTSDLVELTGDELIQIQGYSSLKVTATNATAKNRASISSYTATIASKTVKSSSTEIAVGAISSNGSLELTVTAVDSRGYSTSVTKKVTVLPYTNPKITDIKLRRANSIDAVIQLSFTASMSVIKPDGENDVNSLVDASYRYKLTSAGDTIDDYSDTTSFTSRVVRSDSGTTLTFETNELLSLDTTKSYDFRLVVKDKVASSVTYYVIPKGTPLIAARKDKVGINNPDPKYTLDVDGDINLTGEIYINGVKLSEFLGL